LHTCNPSFQTGDTNFERFLPKNQHTQRKLLNFEFWIKKVPKFDFRSQFSMAKIFLNFFPLKNANVGAFFLLLTFFDKINLIFFLLIKIEIKPCGLGSRIREMEAEWRLKVITDLIS
jgi:hypothetical protein